MAYLPKKGDHVYVIAIHKDDGDPHVRVGDCVEVTADARPYPNPLDPTPFVYLYTETGLTWAQVEYEPPPVPALVDAVMMAMPDLSPQMQVHPVITGDDDPIGVDQSILPTDYDERKSLLVAAVLDYFPLAIVAVSRVIGKGQAQHGTVGWDRAKSADEANTLIRHFLERGTIDTDGVPHSAKVAWRALAILQKEEERRLGVGISRGSYDSSKGEKGPRQP